MRIVVCINPRVPMESAKEGPKYAERSIGASSHVADTNDNLAIARALRELADMITPEPADTGRDPLG